MLRPIMLDGGGAIIYPAGRGALANGDHLLRCVVRHAVARGCEKLFAVVGLTLLPPP